MKNVDVFVSRVLMIAVILIVTTWIWSGLVWLWDWFATTSGTGSVWSEIWDFCKQNVSIFVVVYGLVCLQISGISELKFEKNFLKAFVLAIVLTPPIMMAVYGHKKNKEHGSRGEI